MMARPLAARGVAFALLAFVAAGGLAPARAQLPFDLVDAAADPLAPDWCGVDFTYLDIDTSTGLDAAGVSLADFDDDGLLDIYLPNNLGAASKLYRNLGGFTFQDVAVARGVADAGSSSAVGVFLDYDHDGDLDLWVTCQLGKSGQALGPQPFKLFRNNGDTGNNAFVDVTPLAGFTLLNTPKKTLWGMVSGVCAGDYNQDGWTDLFASWNAPWSSQDQWRLLRNDPNPAPVNPSDPNVTPRLFTDVTTAASGLQGEYGGNPWMPMFFDANRDGWPDLHINQDFTLDLMFLNNHDGTFTNVATAVGLNGDPPEFRNEMGIALGDPDNDLDMDIHKTNVGLADRFYRNDSVKGTVAYVDIAPQSGLTESQFGWGSCFADLDNDGDADHLNVAGVEHDFAKQYLNPVDLNLYPQMLPSGAGVAWQDVTSLLPGFASTALPLGDRAHGLAAGDLDNDGDMDFVVTRNMGEKAGVFRNTLDSPNRWLAVDLVDAGGSRDITAARAYVLDHGVIQMREIFSGSSFLSQDAPRLHFGLGPNPAAGGSPAGTTGSGGGLTAQAGAASLPGKPLVPLAPKRPDWLVVRWDNGDCQVVSRPAANTLHVLGRSRVDDRGDLDADGHLTPIDLAMLQLLATDPGAFGSAYPRSTGPITGDVNDDGVVDGDDVVAWGALPPH